MAEANIARVSGFSAIHRDEVVSALSECSQAFSELSSIFDAIRRGTDADYVLLAAAGRRVAEDLANYSDAISEQVKKGGIK